MAHSTSSTTTAPAAVRSNDSDNRPTNVTNVSLGFMRPLYTSCTEHHHAQADKEKKSESQSRFLCLNELPRMPSPSPSVSPARRPVQESPFLMLPPELRLQIYALCVLPRKHTDLLPSFEKDYDRKVFGTDRPATANLARPTLLIRTIDPMRYSQRYPQFRPIPTRNKYSVRCDRFRSACKSTTYHCVNNPRIEDQLAILRTSKQVHAEAAELLYSSYTFDFDTHVEAIVPFLSDLTPFSRSCIKNVRFVKRALAYEKDFDRCEWSHALRYLTSTSSGISLRKLELGIVAGRPGEDGWARIPKYSAEYFRQCRNDGEGMEWIQYLLEIQGLQELDVSAVVEHCPPATNSSAMANYVRFSASVEGGFSEFLKEQLVQVQV